MGGASNRLGIGPEVGEVSATSKDQQAPVHGFCTRGLRRSAAIGYFSWEAAAGRMVHDANLYFSEGAGSLDFAPTFAPNPFTTILPS
jgi:hypothetical protein